MKEATHTPGPWNLDRHKKYQAEVSGGGWGGFAKIYVRLDGDCHDNSVGIANARLIVASPDLFDACEALVEAVNEDGEVSRLSEFSIVEVREMAVEAIQKARTAVVPCK